MMRVSAAMVVAVLILCAPAARSASAQTVWFVDENAPDLNPDGASWCTAYRDAQAALAAASPGDEIRVADGVYTPAGAGGSRTASFTLASGVALVGGFAGCGAVNPSARDVTLFESILSGDLNRDDDSGGDASENSYHVITVVGADATAVLDGFSITGAFADGPNPSDRGGGMFVFPLLSSPTVRNCRFFGNRVIAKGGAIYGFRNQGTFENCAFFDNQAKDGGAVYSLQSDASFANCVFRNNEATALGGGVLNFSSDPTFSDCTFDSNIALGGGGMHNAAGSPIITRCLFVANVATGSVASAGGGLLSEGSAPIVTNSIFNANVADVTGGGLHANLGSTVIIENCAFVYNLAGQSDGLTAGGGMSNRQSDTSIRSSIFWDNQRGQGVMDESAQVHHVSGTLAVDYTCIMGLTDGVGGVGNIDLPPMFVDEFGPDGSVGTVDDDLRLAAGSPYIDAGDPGFSGAPGVTDLGGNDRIVCDRVDMGPYEFVTVGGCVQGVPTVGSWGVIVLALLLLTGGKLWHTRQILECVGTNA